MWPGRLVLHVDMNAFFASVEQRANPLLRGRPVAVVGDLHRRSVVLTSSYEARAFGVRTGTLLHQARALCPGLVAVAGDHAKYRSVSDEIRRALRTLSVRGEMASCDEACLDFSDDPAARADPGAAARRVRDALAEAVGLPCSVGVAPNKALAKLAAEVRKPNGVTVIRPDDVSAGLRETPVDRLRGVGRRLGPALRAMGILTAAQLGAADAETLYARFGTTGHWLRLLGQGRDDSPVRLWDDAEPPRSVGHSMTFPRNTRDAALLSSYLLLLAEKVGRRLRRGGWRGRTVAVTVRDRDFRTVSEQARLGEATDDDLTVHKAAARLLARRGPPPKPLRLLGVTVSDLTRDRGQGLLLGDLRRRETLLQVLDRVNRRHGDLTLRHAGVEPARRRGLSETPIPPREHAF